jgi:hypothetical protein
VKAQAPVFEEWPLEGGGTEKPAGYPKIIQKDGQSFGEIIGEEGARLLGAMVSESYFLVL